MTDPAPPPGFPPAVLEDALSRLARASVLVVGDAMLDRTIHGSVQRISPEAPVPVLTIEREVSLPGGAGNVVRNITALGAAAAFVSVVGDDQAGSDLTALIGGQPRVEPWLLVEGGRVTTRKTRYLTGGQHLLRADRERIEPLPARLAERLLRIAQDALAVTSVTVLSDYNKGVLAGDVAPRIIETARQLGRKVVVDPKGGDYSCYTGAEVITPTQQELASAAGMEITGPAQLIAAAQHLRDRHGFTAVLATRSGGGMTLVEAGSATHLPAAAGDAVDAAGAGDTAVATLAAGLAAGLDLPLAARLANFAAGLVIGKSGTAVALPAELRAANELAQPGG